MYGQSMSQPGRSNFSGSFEPMANELVQRLEQEHIREVVEVYKDEAQRHGTRSIY